jgi:hypothetical protein
MHSKAVEEKTEHRAPSVKKDNFEDVRRALMRLRERLVEHSPETCDGGDIIETMETIARS